MHQAAEKQFQGSRDAESEKRHNIEEEWTLAGTVDVKDMPKVATGEKGVPMTMCISDGNLDTYYRLCVMGVLGTLDGNGNFTPEYAPVEPVQAVLNSIKLRVGGGFESDLFAHSNGAGESQDHCATRFFMLSGAFRALSSCNATAQPGHELRSKTKRKSKTTGTKRSFFHPHVIHRRRDHDDDDDDHSHDNIDPRVKSHLSSSVQVPKLSASSSPHKSSLKATSSPKPKQLSNEHHTNSRHNKVNSEVEQTAVIAAVPPQMQFSQDEKIVIDRWLAVIGLNEYGEAMSTVYGSERPNPLCNPRTGERVIGRYHHITLIHPERPWMNMAREHGWLPSKHEQKWIRKWARKTKSDKPNRFSTQQTLYEALVQIHPTKPWTDGGIHAKTHRDIDQLAEPMFRDKHDHKKSNSESSSKSGENVKVNVAVNRRQSNSGRNGGGRTPLSPTCRRGKQNGSNEKQLHHEIQNSRRVVAQHMDRVDKGFEDVFRVQAETELIASGATNVDVADIKRASRQLAKEATAKTNEEAQLDWERKEQRRRLQRMEQHQAQLDLREVELTKLEENMRTRTANQQWVNRVSDTFMFGTNDKPEQKPMESSSKDDPWKRSIDKKNIPL